jgi:hypothetical protein
MGMKDLFVINKGTTVSHEFGTTELKRATVAQVVDREWGTVHCPRHLDTTCDGIFKSLALLP